ncbi:MAG: class I SAM-dependent methyltransferase [Aestuariibaculum sp.]
MGNKTLNIKQGHWLLAKMGKKVLRPGGKELTLKLVNALSINNEDNIVEFAPGLGFTAAITLQQNPKSYTGVELNEEAANILRKNISGINRNIVVANAANTELPDNTYNKVYGEAMLTMQADHRKSDIIKEANRILTKGGLYGIHELGLTPNNLSDPKKADIQRELAEVIKVNARPLTENEWVTLLKKEGFEVVSINKNPMHLLEKKRIVQDEGLFRSLKIFFNIATHPKERKQILAMRKVFRKYKNNMNAVAIVAKKVN